MSRKPRGKRGVSLAEEPAPRESRADVREVVAQRNYTRATGATTRVPRQDIKKWAEARRNTVLGRLEVSGQLTHQQHQAAMQHAQRRAHFRAAKGYPSETKGSGGTVREHTPEQLRQMEASDKADRFAIKSAAPGAMFAFEEMVYCDNELHGAYIKALVAACKALMRLHGMEEPR